MPAMPVLHLFALSSRTGKRRGGVFYLFVLLLSLSVLAGECAAPQADSLPAAGGEGSEIAASPTYITIYYEAVRNGAELLPLLRSASVSFHLMYPSVYTHNVQEPRP